MMRVLATDDAWSRTTRLAKSVAVGALVACIAVFVVWFFGFDLRWSVPIALSVGSVSGAIATMSFHDPTLWDPPARITPRGTRLAVITIEQSLAACDRLARPQAIRQLYARLSPERDDLVARANVVRQMRALIVAELRDRGHDPTERPEVALEILGSDALAILQPKDGNPVTTAVIERCLDSIERLATTTPGSR